MTATGSPGDGYAYDAVVLLGFGGPEGPDEVWPFLRRVTAGRGVPDDRLAVVADHYHALGGASPLPEQHRRLSASVATALRERGIPVPVVVAHRNSAPFLDETLSSLFAAGHCRVLALATSAYSSYSGCRQYREDLAAGLAAATGTAAGATVRDARVVKVGPFYDLLGVYEATLDAVGSAIGQALAHRPDDPPVVLFTTHSLPSAMADRAGPAAPPGGASAEPDGVDPDPPAVSPPRTDENRYAAQHRRLAAAVMDELAQRREPALARGSSPPRWRLVYQSRSGPPRVPWLEPDILDAIRQEAADGTRSVVVAPIGFLTDHVEVLWDLDYEARLAADEAGIGLVRAATIGEHPAFVAALADLLAYHLGAGAAPRRLADADDGPDLTRGVCGDTCCLGTEARPAVEGLAR